MPEQLVDANYLDELHKEVSVTLVTQGAERSDQPPNSQTRGASRTDTSGKRYRVQPGDSLWRIAEEAFGDGHQWPAIYDANRRTLQDADALNVGQLLIIPQR